MKNLSLTHLRYILSSFKIALIWRTVFFSSTGRECSYDTTAAVGHNWGEKSQSQSTFCLFRDFHELRSTLEEFANFSRMEFVLSLSYFKSMGLLG